MYKVGDLLHGMGSHYSYHYSTVAILQLLLLFPCQTSSTNYNEYFYLLCTTQQGMLALLLITLQPPIRLGVAGLEFLPIPLTLQMRD
jgi:hypothetical protein